MKKKLLTLVGLMLISLFTAFFGSHSSIVFINSAMANIEHEIDEPGGGTTLPEVTVTCSSGDSGQCWDQECHMEWTPLGGYNVTYCPAFTGYQADICVPEMPC